MGSVRTALVAPVAEAPARWSKHQRAVVVGALVAAVALVVGVLVLDGRGGRDEAAGATSRSAVPSTTTPSTTATPSTTDAAPVPAPVAAPAPPATSPPTVPAPRLDYAMVFDAWIQGDAQALRQLATEPVAELLLARTPEPRDEWSDATCDGAAGSTYCTWTHPDVQLVIRMINETAGQNLPHAVVEAYFTAAPGNVAMWPLMTAQQAADAMAAVQQGHQPWLSGATMVAELYTEHVLGWPDARIDEVQPSPLAYRVTDPASGAGAILTLSEVAHDSEGGIWAVVRAGSS